MKKNIKMVLCVLLSWSLLLNTIVSHAQDTYSETEVAQLETVPGEVLVTYDGVGESEQLFSDIVEEDLSDIPIVATEIIAEDVGEDEKDIVFIEVEDDRHTQNLINQLNKMEGITAQPNYIYHTFDVPEEYEETAVNVFSAVNDPFAEMQYYLNDYNEEGTNSGAGVYKAWDIAKVEKSVTVAVLDTGCDISHPDLKANIDTEHMWDVYNESSNMLDGSGHGTHACGIVGAVADNEIGIAGASYNANILPIKIFDDTGESANTSHIIKAYQYLEELIKSGEIDDLHVVNMSLGAYSSKTENDDALEQIISDFREKYQVLTVAAGGNGKNGKPLTDYCIPSDLDCVLSVTSLNENGGNSVWSDYNEYKDISAPGENIYSTYPNSGYVRMSGTSMATPLVSGIAALLFASTPGVDPDAVVDAIQSTAHSMEGKENDRGSETGSAGAIDATKALKKLTGNCDESDLKDSENEPFTLINVPSVAEGLVYNGKLQEGIPQGEGYELSGQTSAVAAGEYTAYATLKSGYRWKDDPDNTDGPKKFTWSIEKKSARITANNASKIYGERDPELTASIAGVIEGETLHYSIERESGEDVGTYPIRVVESDNPNYSLVTTSAVFTIYAVPTVYENTPPKVDDTYQIGKLLYRVTASSEKKKEVSVGKSIKNTGKKITIPTIVKIDGDIYKVTRIDDKAFYKNMKLRQVVIGDNVTTIGKQAFFGNSKLKKIDIKSKKLKKIGTKAFAKISMKAKFYVPKKKVKAYTAKLKKAKTIKEAKIVKKK